MNTPSTICERLAEALKIARTAVHDWTVVDGLSMAAEQLVAIDAVLAEYAALPPPSPVARDGWKEFIVQCSHLGGMEVDGNTLSEKAKGLLSAAPTPPPPQDEFPNDCRGKQPKCDQCMQGIYESCRYGPTPPQAHAGEVVAYAHPDDFTAFKAKGSAGRVYVYATRAQACSENPIELAYSHPAPASVSVEAVNGFWRKVIGDYFQDEGWNETEVVAELITLEKRVLAALDQQEKGNG